MRLSSAKRDLLEQLPEGDGWPLQLLVHGLENSAAAELQAIALALLRCGLVGVCGRPEDARDLPRAEAEAVLLAIENWRGRSELAWMMAATSVATAALEAQV